LNSQNQAQQSDFSSEELNALIIESVQDIKGKNLLQLDLRHLDDAPASFFIICEGDSNTQVKAISDNIHKRLKDEAGERPHHYEGQQNSMWICMDYFDVVIHIFYKDTRAYYELEDLWSDAIFTEYQDL